MEMEDSETVLPPDFWETHSPRARVRSNSYSPERGKKKQTSVPAAFMKDVRNTLVDANELLDEGAARPDNPAPDVTVPAEQPSAEVIMAREVFRNLRRAMEAKPFENADTISKSGHSWTKIFTKMHKFLEEEKLIEERFSMIVLAYQSHLKRRPLDVNEAPAKVPPIDIQGLLRYVYLHTEEVQELYSRFITQLDIELKKNPPKVTSFFRVFDEFFPNSACLLKYYENLIRVKYITLQLEKNAEFQKIFTRAYEQVKLTYEEKAFDDTTRLWKILQKPLGRLKDICECLEELVGIVKEIHNTQEETKYCEEVLARMEAFKQCAAKIGTDNKELEMIEDAQNRIDGWEMNIAKVAHHNDLKTLGYKRRDLRHFGKLLHGGEVYIRGGWVGAYEPRFVVLMEELIVFSMHKEDKELKKNPAQPYTYEFCVLIKDVANKEQLSKKELKVDITADLGSVTTFHFRNSNGIEKWDKALGALRAYNRCRRKFAFKGHNVTTVSVEVGTFCDASGKMLCGSFQQGLKCIGTNQKKGCGKIFHRGSAEIVQPCEHCGVEIDPSEIDPPWDGDQMSLEHAQMLIPKCPEGTYVLHGKSLPIMSMDEQYFLSFGIREWRHSENNPQEQAKRRTNKVISVHHAIHKSNDEYVIYTFPIRKDLKKKTRSRSTEEPMEFETLEEIVKFVETNEITNIATDDQQYRASLSCPWKEDPKHLLLRSKGLLKMDWLKPEFNMSAYIDLGILKP